MAKTPPVNDYDVEPYTVDELRQLFVAAQQEPNGARWVFALALGLRQGKRWAFSGVTSIGHDQS